MLSVNQNVFKTLNRCIALCMTLVGFLHNDTTVKKYKIAKLRKEIILDFLFGCVCFFTRNSKYAHFV